MKKIILILILSLGLTDLASAQYQVKSQYPTIKRSAILSVDVSAGVIVMGGASFSPVSSSAGLAMTASKTSCAPGTYSSCNIIYASSAGVVASTATASTAFAAGNTIIGFVETSSTAITRIIQKTDADWSDALVYWYGTSLTTGSIQDSFKVVAGTATAVGGVFTITGLPCNVLGAVIATTSSTTNSATTAWIITTSGATTFQASTLASGNVCATGPGCAGTATANWLAVCQ